MNKYYCVTITFLQYVKMGVVDFMKSGAKEEKSTPENIRDSLLTILSGAVVGLLVSKILVFLSIQIDFVKIINFMFVLSSWVFGFFAVVSLIGVTAFFYTSWRKAIKDCWDKFN